MLNPLVGLKLFQHSSWVLQDSHLYNLSAISLFIYHLQSYTKATIIISIISLLSVSYLPAYSTSWTSEEARFEYYVKNSDRIVTGMVIDKEPFDGNEGIWISVYEWLKKGPVGNQIFVRVEQMPNENVEFHIGDEVLLFLNDLDPQRGYFDIFHLQTERQSKYSITMKDHVLSILTPEEREEQLQETENCKNTVWNNDTFLFCTYIDEKMRFPVPISVTDRKSTRLNSSHIQKSRMPSSA